MPGSGLIAGLIGSGQSLPTLDLSSLLSTIQKSGQDARSIINNLPVQVQQQLQQYLQQTNAGADAYKAGITNQGNDYLSKIAGLYGPNSDAANAAMGAAKTQIYSTVPGSQDAIREALAATGGLSRGNAATALARPYVNAAQQYGQAASGIAATQAGKQQDATAQALQVVNSMNDQMFTQMFGMTRQQAQQILTTGNDAIRTQLADLLTQNATETSQTLGVEGLQANNGYQNAVTRNAQEGAIWNGVANLGLQGISAGLSGGGTNMGLPVGADVGSADYMRNALANAPTGY